MSQLLRDILRLSPNVIGGFVCQSHLVSVSPQCVAKSAFYPDQSLLPSQLLVSLAENQLPGAGGCDRLSSSCVTLGGRDQKTEERRGQVYTSFVCRDKTFPMNTFLE